MDTIFYQRFAALCKANGYSPTKASKLMGFSNATPTKWRTAMPCLTNVVKVAEFFAVDEAYLLGNVDTPHASRRATVTVEGSHRVVEFFPPEDGSGEYAAVMCEKGLFSHLVPSGIMILDRNKKATGKAVAIRGRNGEVSVRQLMDLGGVLVAIGPSGEADKADEVEILGSVVEARLTP